MGGLREAYRSGRGGSQRSQGNRAANVLEALGEVESGLIMGWVKGREGNGYSWGAGGGPGLWAEDPCESTADVRLDQKFLHRWPTTSCRVILWETAGEKRAC